MDMEDEVFPPLPPPLSPGQTGSLDNEDEDGAADASQLADVPAAKRKGVKRPQPKLDSQRLISERGLPALRTLFDDVCFKGKGHEAEDLRLLMQKMENWAHRLYPKLQFEAFIDKVEKLGTKKDVQTCLKRIRLDMPLTHQDFMAGEEEEEAPESRAFEDPDPFNSSSFMDLPAAPVSAQAPPLSAQAPPPLTEEQQQRMELNRQRALKRRLTRQQTDSQTADSSSSAHRPSSVSPANDSQDPEEADHQQQQQQQEPGQLSHTHTPSDPLGNEEEELFLRGESGR
ncbi:TIMELESS-interacting protein [Clinocottus analis]|uniref:TIMELESS-interacting protein n=1 Tax=Clinocottus analis TaxID=304258 RepID=UPI0035BF1BF7